jgi:hypothetical protein
MRIDICQQYTIDELQQQWTSMVEQCSSAHIFLDWYWIGTWLKLIAPITPVWIKCYEGGSCVGMTLVCHTGRSSLFGYQSGWFTKTGQQKYDQIWIEYNDILAKPECHNKVIQSVLDWCATQDVDNWLVEITATPEAWLEHAAFTIECDKTPAYGVDLDPSYSDINCYLATRSANGRSTIRRAIRFVDEHYGEVKLLTYQNRPPTEVWHEMSQLHQERWRHTAENSGFANPYFVQFHEQLMATPTTNCHSEILAFYAGKHCLGYTYNLIKDGHVYFYLSGINYSDDNNRYRPGLVMHAMAIQYFAQAGYQFYDFMGGDSQYKRSLATSSYALARVSLRKKNLKNTVVNYLRDIKQKLLMKPT